MNAKQTRTSSASHGVASDVASIHGGNTLIAVGEDDFVVRYRNVFTSSLFSLSSSASH